MKTLYLATICIGFLSIGRIFACDCTPASTEEQIDDKIYSGANYSFFTAEILSVQSAFHLEVSLQVEEVFYGSQYIKDVMKPFTVYFDLRTACAITQVDRIKAGEKLFITSAYNSMGRMFITNNCDAFFPADQIDVLKLRDYLNDLKNQN